MPMALCARASDGGAATASTRTTIINGLCTPGDVPSALTPPVALCVLVDATYLYLRLGRLAHFPCRNILGLVRLIMVANIVTWPSVSRNMYGYDLDAV